MMLHEFPQGSSVSLGERVSQKVTGLVLCSRSTLATEKTERRKKNSEKWRKKFACVEAVWNKGFWNRLLYVFIYKKGFTFPVVRKNINGFTGIIRERKKELKLCSNRPLEWAGDSYLEIKIQKEIDLCLLALIWGVMVIY